MLLVQESKARYVELVLEEAQIAMPVLDVNRGTLVGNQEIIVDAPIALDVKVPEFGAHGSALFT